jgi:hypothetical protein
MDAPRLEKWKPELLAFLLRGLSHRIEPEPADARAIWRHPLEQAAHLFGQLGGAVEREELRKYVTDPLLGRAAISAIAEIDQRAQSNSGTTGRA